MLYKCCTSETRRDVIIDSLLFLLPRASKLFGFPIFRPLAFLASKDFQIVWLSNLQAVSFPCQQRILDCLAIQSLGRQLSLLADFYIVWLSNLQAVSFLCQQRLLDCLAFPSLGRQLSLLAKTFRLFGFPIFRPLAFLASKDFQIV